MGYSQSSLILHGRKTIIQAKNIRQQECNSYFQCFLAKPTVLLSEQTCAFFSKEFSDNSYYTPFVSLGSSHTKKAYEPLATNLHAGAFLQGGTDLEKIQMTQKGPGCWTEIAISAVPGHNEGACVHRTVTCKYSCRNEGNTLFSLASSISRDSNSAHLKTISIYRTNCSCIFWKLKWQLVVILQADFMDLPGV